MAPVTGPRIGRYLALLKTICSTKLSFLMPLTIPKVAHQVALSLSLRTARTCMEIMGDATRWFLQLMLQKYLYLFQSISRTPLEVETIVFSPLLCGPFFSLSLKVCKTILFYEASQSMWCSYLFPS